MGAMPRIKTERLLLRPFCLYDAKPYFTLIMNPEVLNGTDMPHELDEVAIREWIVGHPEFWQHRRELFMLVTSLETREIVGSVSIFTHDRHNKAEMGYWVARSMWGKGYGTEAGMAMVEYAFETMKLNRLEANHLLRNPSSGRVLEKIGFKYEGLLRQSYLKDGVFEDLVYYGLLRKEFLENKKVIKEIESEVS